MSRKRRKKTIARRREQPKPSWLWIAGPVIAAGAIVFVAIHSISTESEAVATNRTPERPRLQIPAMPSERDLQGVPRITATDAHRLFERDAAVFVDVRDLESYGEAHVPGALQIPLGYVAGELPHFPRDRRLIAYCT